MKQVALTPELYQYMLDVSLCEHPVMHKLRQKNATHMLGMMQIAPEQAQFMQFLLKITNSKRVLELGTFTGYSALAMALALPEDGYLLTLDINKEWTQDAHDYWQEAGVAHKIELKIAPALQTLASLINEGHAASFDFIFIDADKTAYMEYYEYALKLIKPTGIIAIDNMFWEGLVIDENETGAQVREIRKLNRFIKDDPRVEKSFLPIADGLYLVKPRNTL